MKRRKTGVRLVSILLTVAMLFALMPATVAAEGQERILPGEGVEILPIESSVVRTPIVVPATEFDVSIDFQKHLEKIEAFRLFVENKSSNDKEITDSDFFKKEYAIEFLNQMIISGEIKGIPLLDPKMQYVPEFVSFKDYIRAQLWLVALPVGIVFPNASYFFRHSLQDNPPDLYLFNHPIMDVIRNNGNYVDRIDAIRKHLLRSPFYSRIDCIVFERRDGVDLHLTLNRARLRGRSRRALNRLDITVTDRYNFEWMENLGYREGVVDWAVTIINNLAVDAQNYGAVVPYDITIFHTYRDVVWMPL